MSNKSSGFALVKMGTVIKKLQKNCKHKKTEITQNIGDYVYRKVCSDCNKILDFKFIQEVSK